MSELTIVSQCLVHKPLPIPNKPAYVAGDLCKNSLKCTWGNPGKVQGSLYTVPYTRKPQNLYKLVLTTWVSIYV